MSNLNTKLQLNQMIYLPDDIPYVIHWNIGQDDMIVLIYQWSTSRTDD